MITIRKLLTLEPRLRLRKCSAVFHQAAQRWPVGESDLVYLHDLQETIRRTVPEVPGEGTYLLRLCSGTLTRTLCDDICYAILALLGAEPADWDFTADSGRSLTDPGVLDPSRREVRPFTLVLDRLRSPFNVGSVFRSADSFGVEKIILIEGTASPLHPRAQRTARGTTETVTWEFLPEDDAVALLEKVGPERVFALEVGGQQLADAKLPEDGIAIIGSEEFGVSPNLLLCAGKKVSIPMAGTKGSLNVSVATGILLHAWFTKGRR